MHDVFVGNYPGSPVLVVDLLDGFVAPFAFISKPGPNFCPSFLGGVGDRFFKRVHN